LWGQTIARSGAVLSTPIAAAFQFVPGDCKNAISLLRSSADASPPYGFILLPGTTSSGFAMKLASFSLSHTKSAPFPNARPSAVAAVNEA